MSNLIMMYISIIAVVIGVLGTMIGIMPALKKKGVNVDKALDTANDVVKKADTVLNVAKEILPANPIINVLSIIEKWAKIAAGDAEQLYHAGDINKDQRAAVAEQDVLNVLKELNITLDDNKKALINAVIRNAVNDLGHAPIDVKQLQDSNYQLQSQNSQLQSEKDQLKTSNDELQSENNQLKQTISTAQAAINGAQATNIEQ